MKLAKGEYTTSGFISLLKEKYKCKINGKSFTTNDIAQYLIKGFTPHAYGHMTIEAEHMEGIRIIKIKS
jgi:hypothetical protein